MVGNMFVDSSAVVRTQTPESLFRVGPPRDEGERCVIRMQAGPWMDDLAGRTSAGALGVLVDDAVGHRIFMTRPADRASVTSELSMDVLVPPPWDTELLRAESRLLHTDDDGGFAECRVLDDTDRLIAVATTWCRYIALPAGVSIPENDEDWPLNSPGDRHTLFDVLGAQLQPLDDGMQLVLAPSAELTNPLGMAHGGVLIAGTEIAGQHAVAQVMNDPVTTSVRMNYLRPALMDAQLRFTADVVHRGRSVSVAQVRSHGASGKPCTIGMVTCRTRPVREKRS